MSKSINITVHSYYYITKTLLNYSNCYKMSFFTPVTALTFYSWVKKNCYKLVKGSDVC